MSLGDGIGGGGCIKNTTLAVFQYKSPRWVFTSLLDSRDRNKLRRHPPLVTPVGFLHNPDTLLSFVLLQDYKEEEDPALFHSAKTGRGPLSPDWKVPDISTGAEKHRLLNMMMMIIIIVTVICLSFTEWAVDRLSSHVCIQTGHCQVQMVGTANQSGRFHPEGNSSQTMRYKVFHQSCWGETQQSAIVRILTVIKNSDSRQTDH